MRGPLKWHGGKTYLAAEIVKRMPKHRHYVEPYCGGAAVFFARDPDDARLWVGKGGSDKGVSEVLNDKNAFLMNFWACLQHPQVAPIFMQMASCTPLSRQSYEDAAGRLARGCNIEEGTTCVSCGLAFFVACRQSLAGRMQGFTATTRGRTRRGMNGNVSEWLGAVEGLPEVAERLRRALLECMDAEQLIPREDTPETLFYCDPPYLFDTRATTGEYKHEMTAKDHERMLCILLDCKGKVMLSGYESELYTHYLKGWNKETFDLPNNAAGGDAKRRMTECLWTNF